MCCYESTTQMDIFKIINYATNFLSFNYLLLNKHLNDECEMYPFPTIMIFKFSLKSFLLSQ